MTKIRFCARVHVIHLRGARATRDTVIWRPPSEHRAVEGTCDERTDIYLRASEVEGVPGGASPPDGIRTLHYSSNFLPRSRDPSDLPLPSHPRVTTQRSVFGNSVLLSLDEDSLMDEAPTLGSVGRALPARLAHLQGPTRIVDSREMETGSEISPPREISENIGPSFVAPGTPPTHTVRGSRGQILMGPWGGAFSRADGGDGSNLVTEDTGLRASREESREIQTGDKSKIDSEHVEIFSDLVFCGVDDLRIDSGNAVTTELVSEDAITGRVRESENVEQDRRAGRPTDRATDLHRRSSRHVDGLERRRRVNSAPAATRRIGAARVATRKRPSAQFLRAKRERFHNLTKESGKGGGSGGASGGRGYFGKASQTRNAGAQATMGARVTQPRGF